jgi:hypothetical protein
VERDPSASCTGNAIVERNIDARMTAKGKGLDKCVAVSLPEEGKLESLGDVTGDGEKPPDEVSIEDMTLSTMLGVDPRLSHWKTMNRFITRRGPADNGGGLDSSTDILAGTIPSDSTLFPEVSSTEGESRSKPHARLACPKSATPLTDTIELFSGVV